MAKVFGRGFESRQLHKKGFSQENPFLLWIYQKKSGGILPPDLEIIFGVILVAHHNTAKFFTSFSGHFCS